MRRKFLSIFLSVSVLLISLSSCGSAQIDEQKEDSLTVFTTKLSSAVKAEYNLKQTIDLGQSEEKQYSHVEYTKDPFNSYFRMGRLTEDSFVIVENRFYNKENETYQYTKVELAQPFSVENLSVDENGNFSVDNSLMEVDQERETSIDGSDRDLMLKWLNHMELYDIAYLIDKNMVSFKSQEEEINGIECIRYDGTISVDSVVDMYSNSGRERMEAKLKFHDIEPEFKENPSKEEKKNELKALYKEGVDIAEGMYELVFAEESTPIRVWVPVNEGEPYRIQIDFSNAYKNKNIKLFDLDFENKYCEKTVEYIITLIK